jgi:hypothetical protein
MDVNSKRHKTAFPKKAIIFNIIIIAFLSFFQRYSIGQNLDRKISFSMRNIALIEVINKITEVAQVSFSYSPQLIPLDKKISVKVKNKSVKDVLDAIFKGNGIDYIIIENQIVLKPLVKGNIQNNGNNLGMEKKTHTISGYLKDKKTGEVMIGASVFANGTMLGAITNAYGFYSLTLPNRNYDIVFSFVGYKNISQNVELNEDKIISVELEDAMLDIKPVVVKDSDNKSSINNNQFSEMKLSPKLLTQLPGFLGDIDVIKSLQIIPGIKSYGDGSTLFYVRGGNSDQNLIMIDDAPIYNPSHLFGFITAITPDAVKDIEAFKGDFPVNYGGRLSSVIDIRTKDGDMKKIGFSGSLGPFTSDLSIDGPIINDKCSFYISGRIANMWWLPWLPYFSNDNLSLNFFDINAKLNYKLNNNNHIFLTLYGSNDTYYSSPTEITWDNILGTLRWNHIFNDKLFSNTTLYSTQYDYYLYFNNNYNDYWGSSISDKTIKTDFTYYLNPKNTIKAGVAASIQSSDPGNLHLSNPEAQANVPAVSTYSSREFDAYISNEQYINNKLSVRYGLRVPVWLDMGPTSVYSFDQNHNVTDTLVVGKGYEYASFISPEPRINMKYSLNKSSCLKASYSRTTQFVQLLSNSTSPFSSLEEWVPCGPNVEPPKADQYALGYFRNLYNPNINLSVETYYKQFHNQMDYADHANIFFNPLLEGQLRFGKAWSYGAEFMLSKEEGNFTWRIGYAYSRIFEQINDVNNGNKFPSSYDSPNNICLNASYRMNKHWSFSANWVYYTGEAYTTPIGFYYYNGYSVPLYGNKNNDRLPDYNRLDISITCKLSKPERRYQHTLIFTVYNVYNRRNPISVNFNKIDDNGNYEVPTNLNGEYNLVPTTISMVRYPINYVGIVSIIPSITYNFKFR